MLIVLAILSILSQWYSTILCAPRVPVVVPLLHRPSRPLHVVRKDGVSVVDVKVSAVCNWPVPNTVWDVQGFLGIISFYKRFFRSFVKISEPLTSLKKKGHVFEWTEAC